MNPSPELLQDLRREEIADARRLSFAQKFIAGAALFDYACQVTRSGIRMQHPEFNEQQVLDELRRRLALIEQSETLR